MTITVYDQSVAVMSRMLGNLAGILRKAGEQAAARKYDPQVLLQARLFPDMFNLTKQVQLTTDFAKGTAARLSGQELPSWPDTEVSLEELQGRVQKALDYLARFQPAQFDGAEARTVELKLPNSTLSMSGQEYLLGFGLPNFYFHLTTAYNILRHNGIEIGKRDFVGERPAR